MATAARLARGPPLERGVTIGDFLVPARLWGGRSPPPRAAGLSAGGTENWSAVTGGTGGYIIGFIVAAAVVGRLAELGWDRRLGGAVAAMLIGSVVVYALGLPWLALNATPC